MDFDPNTKAPKTPEWATYVPGRSTAPAFKVHNNRGQALNALSGGGLGILYNYDFDQSKWVEKFRLEGNKRSALACENCKTKFKRQYHGVYTTWRKKGSKVAEPLQYMALCNDCDRKNRNGGLG